MNTSISVIKELYENRKYENKIENNYNDKNRPFSKGKDDNTLIKILNNIYAQTEGDTKKNEDKKKKKEFNK